MIPHGCLLWSWIRQPKSKQKGQIIFFQGTNKRVNVKCWGPAGPRKRAPERAHMKETNKKHKFAWLNSWHVFSALIIFLPRPFLLFGFPNFLIFERSFIVAFYRGVLLWRFIVAFYRRVLSWRRLRACRWSRSPNWHHSYPKAGSVVASYRIA